MARKRGSIGSMSQQEAHNVLTFLVHQGELAASTVERALRNREKIVGELRDRLAALGIDAVTLVRRSAKDGPFPAASNLRRKKTSPKKPPARRQKPVSAALRKSRQAHGRYLGSIRQLSKSDREKIKAIRAKSGINAAVRAAKSRLAEQRFLENKNPKPARPRRGKSSRRRSAGGVYPTAPAAKPDKHGHSGAGREQGGSGAGREHD